MEEKSSKIHLSVIIPAYNEEKRLPKTLKEIDNYLKKQSYLSEIIVVNGGSTDKTTEIVKEFQKEIPTLKLISNEGFGKGYSVKQGILEAKGNYRIFTDADNSTSIDQIEKMWPWLEKGYDIVIGSRDIKGAVLAVPQPWIRKVILGEGFKLLRKIIIGLWEIEDTQCGFKCFTEKSAIDIFPKITIWRFGFDPEALVLAKKLGYKIKEVPIAWINDVESKVKFKSIIEMFFETLKIRLNMILGKYKKVEQKMEKISFRKIDLIFALIVGEMVTFLVLGILEGYGVKIKFLNWILIIFLPILSLVGLWISYLLGKKFLFIFQAAKFLLTGVFATLVDLGVFKFLGLIFVLNISWIPVAFKGISFLVATFAKYWGNKFWAFEKMEKAGMGKEITQFYIVTLIGLGINVGVFSLIINTIGPQFGTPEKTWETLGVIIAAVVVSVWNFLGYKFIVFKK